MAHLETYLTTSDLVLPICAVVVVVTSLMHGDTLMGFDAGVHVRAAEKLVQTWN